MKKIYFAYIYCCILILISCTGTDSTTQKSTTNLTNHLVQNTIHISYEYDLYVPQEYWFMKGISAQEFITNLYKKTAEGTVPVYLPLSNTPYPPEDAQLYFTKQENGKYGIPIEEVTNIVFTEEWILDTAQFLMEKRVVEYSLVRQQTKEVENGKKEHIKTLIATYKYPHVSKKTHTDLQLLTTDVTYEVPLDNPIVADWLDQIPVPHVVQVVLDKITDGTQPTYSFMVRDSLIELSNKEVREKLGEQIYSATYYDEETNQEEFFSDTLSIDYSECKGFAFIEDWFIDESNMQIYKKVSGIAPVREYAKILDQEDYELVRTIPCLTFFSNYVYKK